MDFAAITHRWLLTRRVLLIHSPHGESEMTESEMTECEMTESEMAESEMTVAAMKFDFVGHITPTADYEHLMTSMGVWEGGSELVDKVRACMVRRPLMCPSCCSTHHMPRNLVTFRIFCAVA